MKEADALAEERRTVAEAAVKAAQGQGLTLVHFSAQPDYLCRF
jgi:hypothetical protein